MAELAATIGLACLGERDAAGNPLLAEDEAVLQSFEGVKLVLGADADQGEGKLFIMYSRVAWLSGAGADPARGYACDFTAISMHAVSSDPDSFAQPCLYVQLDGGDGPEEEDDDAPLPELRLVPADAAQLDAIFQAFCDGAERNPDEEEGGGEGQGDFFFDRAEVLAGAAGVALSSLDTNDADELAGEDPGRFGDAEEEGGEEEDEDGYEEFEGEQGAAPPANGSHKKG